MGGGVEGPPYYHYSSFFHPASHCCCFVVMFLLEAGLDTETSGLQGHSRARRAFVAEVKGGNKAAESVR